MPTITLPGPDGRPAPFTPSAPRGLPDRADRPLPRVALAAAHVIADALAPADPTARASLDWDATLAVRHRLWDLGLGVAEAMDGAQREAGLDASTALELIRRTLAEARARPGARVVCGCGTDGLEPGHRTTVSDVLDAYLRQAEAIESAGGRLVLRPSRELAAVARSPDQVALVCERLLAQVREPAVVGWPIADGEPSADDPDDTQAVAAVMIEVIRRNAAKVDGVIVGPAAPGGLAALRRRLPPGMRLYTGDETGYPGPLDGDADGHADALLGILGAIAPVASAALSALGEGDAARCRALLDATVPLARHVAAPPARLGAVDVACLAWLNGEQPAFALPGGLQSARGAVHLAALFRLADAAGLLRDPERACARMRALMAVHGVG